MVRKLLVVLGCALALASWATPAAAQDIPGGLKLLLLRPELDGSPGDFEFPDFGPRTTIGFGGYLTVEVSDTFIVQPELLWVRKGGKGDVVSNGVRTTITLNVNYVELPVLVRWNLAPGSSLNPHVYAGPSFGLKTSANLDFSVEGVDFAPTRLEDEIRAFDFSLVGGGGIEMPRGSYSLVLEGRFGLGLSNVVGDELDPGADFNNRAIMLLFGIKFHGDGG